MENQENGALTKHDMERLLGDQTTTILTAVDERMQKMDGRLDKMDGRLDKMDLRLGNLETDFKQVKDDVNWMKENSSALFEKLDKYIALYEKQEQETALLTAQVRRLEERVVVLEAGRRA